MASFDVPSAEERERLLDGCARIIAQIGSDPVVTGPVVLATETFFPEPVPGTIGGVRALLRRFLVFAGLEHLQPTLEVFGSQAEIDTDLRHEHRRTAHRDVAAFFSGIHQDTAYFGFNVESWSDQDGLLGTLAHEVAHAYRCDRGIQVITAETEEQLTDLTAVLLGFGALLVNASFRHRAVAAQDGRHTAHQWTITKSGYLPPESLAFLFAVHLRLRVAVKDVGAILAELDVDHARSVRACMKKVPGRNALAERLGLPPHEEWPALRDFDPDDLAAVDEQADDDEPLDGQSGDDDDDRDDDGADAHADSVTYTIPTLRRFNGVIVGAVAGIVIAPLVGVVGDSSTMALVAFVGGAALVPTLRLSRCADPDCDRILWRRGAHCPGCSRLIHGELASRSEWLDVDRTAT